MRLVQYKRIAGANSQTELDELKTRARAFLARVARQADDPLAGHAAATVADEEVELELMRRKQAGPAEEA